MNEVTLSQLVKETTTILKDLIIEQGRKLDQIATQYQVVEQNKKEIERLCKKFDGIESKVNTVYDLVTSQAATSAIIKEYQDKFEARAYSERQSMLERIFKIAGQVAGIAALIYLVVERII